VVLGALLLGALLLGTFGRAQAAERVSVGSKAFTEQLLLGKMTALLLREAGFDVRERIPLGGTNIVRQALLSRQIDGYVEYTGTAATVFFKRTEPFASARECYEFVRDRDAAQGLVWLSPMAFNNTYCLMMRRQEAEDPLRPPSAPLARPLPRRTHSLDRRPPPSLAGPASFDARRSP
jgi:osmoprotectant transport system substrate-binding protein